MTYLKTKRKPKKIYPKYAYADIGSHNRIFFFESGIVGGRYPYLLHIYSKRVTSDLVKIKIERVE